MAQIKKFLAQIVSVLKAEPHVRKAAAAFYATVVLGVLTAVMDGHVTSGEIKTAVVVAAGAAVAAWKATNATE